MTLRELLQRTYGEYDGVARGIELRAAAAAMFPLGLRLDAELTADQQKALCSRAGWDDVMAPPEEGGA